MASGGADWSVDCRTRTRTGWSYRPVRQTVTNSVPDFERETVARYCPSGLNCTPFAAWGPRGDAGRALTRPVCVSTAYRFDGVFGVTAGFSRNTSVRRSGDHAPPPKRLFG